MSLLKVALKLKEIQYHVLLAKSFKSKLVHDQVLQRKHKKQQENF